MPHRRQVLKLLLRFWSTALALTGIDLVRAQRLYAAAKKRVLPANTDPQNLRNADPKYLDTHKLPIMPLERFRTMGEVNAVFDPQHWRLTVDGKVARPLSLTYEGVRNRPAITRNVLLICPGVFVNHGRWKGISLGDLLNEAGLLKEAQTVIFHTDTGAHQRTERFDIAEVAANHVFLAYGVNGRDLPEKHGHPLRVVAEGHYGATWAKYVKRVEVR
jgi:DMSO/TMAO reductase YedYZ molybdopterin-dependent catalytic subunit